MLKICSPKRGITVPYEAIRQWCRTFGPVDARTLRRRRGHMGETWYLDEVFVTIQGRQQYLWRAVDEDGDVIDILVQSRRDRRAAKRFFRKLLKRQGREPRRLITDRLLGFRAVQLFVLVGMVAGFVHGVGGAVPVSQPASLGFQPQDTTGSGSRYRLKRGQNWRYPDGGRHLCRHDHGTLND